ncbi:MAG: aldehyde dehydrogenase [Flavobacteriaceae bacterium]
MSEQHTYLELRNKQADFFASAQTLDCSFRIAQLKKLRQVLRSYEGEILEALKLDLNKPNFEAYTAEFSFVIEELNTAIKQLKKWSKPRKVKTGLLSAPAFGVIQPEPYGLSLQLSPWNYPFQLAIAPALAALAAGNTVVLKPSEYSIKTSELLAQLINTHFDEAYFHVVLGAAETAKALLELKWDHIFFTGSTQIGKIVAKAAAEKLTPCTLELGGKSPCIVDDTAKVKLAAKRIVWGKYMNAGQTCIAPDYVLVDAKIKEDLIAQMMKEIERLYGKNPKESSDYGRLIHSRHVERMKSFMEDANIRVGGALDAESRFVAPTIIDEVNHNSKAMQEEIFGPVLPVISYDNFEEVGHYLKRYDKPLAFYIFSENAKRIKALVQNYQFGGGCVNDTIMHIAEKNLPFGGVGDSGMGAYHGKFGFSTFSREKPVMYRSNWIDVPLRYPPFKNKLGTVRKFIRLASKL